MKKILKLFLTAVVIYLAFSAGILFMNINHEKYTNEAQSFYGTDAFFEKYYLNYRRSLKGVPRIQSTDKQLVELGKTIGLKHIDKVTIRTEESHKKELYGYYDDRSRSIHINKNQSDDRLKTALAHEYLHFIWFEPESLLSTDGKLSSELVKLHNIPRFFNHIKTKYIDENIYHTSELFSFACTELKDDQLEPYTLSQCNKWVDRSKLPIATEDKHF